MGSLDQDIKTALLFMPEHRQKSKRSRSLHLDTLLENFRRQSDVSASSLDLILMGYRYSGAFEIAIEEFFGKANKFSPATLADLWQILFAALLSRDKTPAGALVDAGVHVARELFGERTTKVTNAFLRKLGREKDDWLKRLEANPALLLPKPLQERWKNQPQLIERSARYLRERPAAGFWAFDEQGAYRKFESAELDQKKIFQAMDPGSWNFMQWAAARVQPRLGAQPLVYLDACAAPGGKLIAMHTLLKGKGLVEYYATEPKFPRRQMLEENLRRWNLSDVEVSDHGWGSSEVSDDRIDVALADLPCTGSGTFHTRPDLLQENPFTRLPDLKRIQTDILADLKKHLNPTGLLLVSICSVDPEEVANLSSALGREPDFQSWQESTEAVEGITAWAINNG